MWTTTQNPASASKEAHLFFTFFALDAIHVKRIDPIDVATVGNPGMHIPALLGGLPEMSALATHMMTKKMHVLDIPPIGEFYDMAASGQIIFT